MNSTVRSPFAHSSRLVHLRGMIRRAFAEFLMVPTLVIGLFLLAVAGTYALDHLVSSPAGPFREFMKRHVFGNAKATSDLLRTVASGLITVVSITFSLLLLAVQQSAAALTNQVFDQFLRRRFNQFFFGFFVGLTLYSLIILATVAEPYNPVYGATLALLLVVVALSLLIVLLYTTVDQMRPAVIIDAIHRHTLAARRRHRDLLHGVRPSPSGGRPARASVLASEHGYVVRIHAGAIDEAAAKVRGGAEVVLNVQVGSFVGYRDEVAAIWADDAGDARGLEPTVRGAIVLERQRDLDHDPAFGIEQLHTIAWTSISTAKSNPAPGLLVIRSLRDLLVRWSDEEASVSEPGSRPGRPSAVVYHDNVPERAMEALESLTIAASESMQHLSLAEIYRNLAAIFDRMTPGLRNRAEDLVRRSLSTLGDHVLSSGLEAALNDLARSLGADGRTSTADALVAAGEGLKASIGSPNSQATRVSGREDGDQASDSTGGHAVGRPG